MTLSPLKLDKAARTSSLEKGISRASESTLGKESNTNLPMLDLYSSTLDKIMWKAFATPSLMLSSSDSNSQFTLILAKKFLLQVLAILWNKLVFLSPFLSKVLLIGNDKGIYWTKKEVQEKDEKSSHKRKLNYKNTKIRKYIEKQVSTLD